MSVESIGSVGGGVESLLGAKAVNEASASPASDPKPQDETAVNAGSRVDSKTAEEYRESEKSIYASQSSTSTQDFLFLRGLGEEEGQFDALDKTIKEMKENIEAVGDAIEAMVEMIEKSSDSSIALKLIEGTIEEMEKMNENSGGETGEMPNTKA